MGGAAKTGRMPSDSSFSQPVALWSLPAGATERPFPFSHPVFDGTAVWLAADSQLLVALDPLTGAALVQSEVPGVTMGPVVAGDAIILGFRDGSVASFDVETGTGNWKTLTSGGILTATSS